MVVFLLEGKKSNSEARLNLYIRRQQCTTKLQSTQHNLCVRIILLNEIRQHMCNGKSRRVCIVKESFTLSTYLKTTPLEAKIR